MPTLFLHGLDSSGNGTKGRFFQEHFPETHTPNFDGSLENRLEQLENLCFKEFDSREKFIFIGSSFGGLMAACFAKRYPKHCTRLILMAPALNFPGYKVPPYRIAVPTSLLIGKHDTVTPAQTVIPLARQTFDVLDIKLVDDDHLLHDHFTGLDWRTLLQV